MLEQSPVYLPFRNCDISEVSLQPKCLCGPLCRKTTICPPNIPVTAPEKTSFASQMARNTARDYSMPLKPAAVLCLGESCILLLRGRFCYIWRPSCSRGSNGEASIGMEGLVPLQRVHTLDSMHPVTQA